jgi:hypothetical protein
MTDLTMRYATAPTTPASVRNISSVIGKNTAAGLSRRRECAASENDTRTRQAHTAGATWRNNSGAAAQLTGFAPAQRRHGYCMLPVWVLPP